MEKQLYIDLLKKVLTDYHRIEFSEYKPFYTNNPTWKLRLLMGLNTLLSKKDLTICKKVDFKPEDRLNGTDWPSFAETMIGIKRLENIEYCINKIIEDNIPGDFIEAGVWRGGATIFMKAILKINQINDKIIWVADSFEGLPKPNEGKYIADKGDKHYKNTELAISVETVKNNFRKYDLLDENVKFLKGWFKDTLPVSPINELSLLRLDGDMYESTMDGLVSLYPKLSIGGFIIIDDWGAVKGCKQAVNDYRKEYNIIEEIKKIDWTGVYWRKQK